MIKYIFLFFVLLFFSMVNSEMLDFLKPNKIMVSPPVSGVVLKGGEPVENIELSLLAGFNKYYHRVTRTNEQGRFYFEPINHSQWFKPLSINTNLIGIQIVASFNNHEVLLWSSHTGLKLYDYILDNLDNLECDIDDVPHEYHFKNRVVPSGRSHSVYGICRLRGYEEKITREDL